MLERFKLTSRTWLWLERATDVRRACSVVPGIRCTLLRPGSWDEPLRTTYFSDAQNCGACGVSLQPCAIDATVIAQARARDLLVFTRIDNDDAIGQLILAGVGGVITDDPAATLRAIDEYDRS